MKNIKYIIILAFFLINLAFLMDFPSIHSDELWLKGIAEQMLKEKTFNTTEPFFDLYPRTIHPFRWLYNAVIILALTLVSPNVISVRLISLVFGTLTIWVISGWLERIVKSKWLTVAGLCLLTLDIQFVYASHMGRQETFILFLLVLGLSLVQKYAKSIRTSKLTGWLSCITLLGMGVHPNSFILGVTFSGILIYLWINQQLSIKIFVRYIAYTIIGTLGYVFFGLILNSNFLNEYFKYGAALGVDAPLTNRFEGFYWYFYKLFHQIGGTYDLFDIRMQLSLMVIIVFSQAILWLKFKRVNILFPTFIGIGLSLFLIGRYNQLAVVFFSPFIVLSVMEMLSVFNHKKRVQIGLVIILLSLWSLNLISNLTHYDQQRFYTLKYEDMLNEIKSTLPSKAKVLSNLNTIEAFEAHSFYDIRNLGYLSNEADALNR